jgi:WD repeat-containing protein 45
MLMNVQIFFYLLFHLVICADGSCCKFLFDPRKGGECIRESYERFLKDQDDEL